MKSRGVILCALLCLAASGSSQVLAQVDIEFAAEDERPEDGQGSIFADGIASATFQWTDFDGDYLVVSVAGTEDDFVRRTPSGKDFVHYASPDPQFLGAIVGGLIYIGDGLYQSAYWGQCDFFSADPPGFSCFIGGGPASMNAHAAVVRQIDGASCTLSAHLAAFYQDNPQRQGTFVANSSQYDIKVTCD